MVFYPLKNAQFQPNFAFFCLQNILSKLCTFANKKRRTKMKRKLIGVFAALALFAGCLGLVACGEEKDPCADGHDWGEWTVTKSATCTEKGSRTRSCKNGDKTETEEIPMLAHTYDGTETNYCTVCKTYYVGTEAQLRELSPKQEILQARQSSLPRILRSRRTPGRRSVREYARERSFRQALRAPLTARARR